MKDTGVPGYEYTGVCWSSVTPYSSRVESFSSVELLARLADPDHLPGVTLGQSDAWRRVRRAV